MRRPGWSTAATGRRSASWAVPADAVSGIYFAKLVREDGNPGASHVVFVVRDDDGALGPAVPDVRHHLAGLQPLRRQQPVHRRPARPGRAYKVSYNRPFTTRDYAPEDWVFNAEYPMVRWIERNGYDVSYSTGVDSHRRGAELLEHESLPLGRPRRVLVGRPARQRGGGPRGRASTSRSSAATRCSGRRAGSRASTARRPPTARSSPTRRPTRTPRSTRSQASGPAPGATRASARRPTAAGPENALTGQLFMVNARRHDGDRGARGRRQDALLAQHERRHAGGRRNRDAPRRHARLRVGRGPRQRLPPGRLVRPVDQPPSRRPGAPGPRLDLRLGHRHPPPDAVPALERRARVRRRHGAVVLGPRRPARPRQRRGRRPHAAGHRSTCLPTWAPSRRPSSPAWSAASATTDATAPSSTITSPAAGRTARRAAGRSPSPARPPTRWRRGRAASRSRWTAAAPGTGPTAAAPGPTTGPRRERAVHHQQPRRGRQRQPARPPPPASPARIGSASLPVLDLEQLDGAGERDRAERHQRGRAGREVPRRRSTATSPACASTRAPPTPAPTSATSGRAPARCSPRPPSRARRARGWQQVTLSNPVSITAGTTYVASYHAPVGRYAWNRNFFASRASTAGRCARSRTARTAATASTPTARAGPSPTTPTCPRTTGSTSSSSRARPPTPRRRRSPS